MPSRSAASLAWSRSREATFEAVTRVAMQAGIVAVGAMYASRARAALSRRSSAASHAPAAQSAAIERVVRALDGDGLLAAALGQLDDGADLNMELTVQTGKGYVAADKNRPEGRQGDGAF